MGDIVCIVNVYYCYGYGFFINELVIVINVGVGGNGFDLGDFGLYC